MKTLEQMQLAVDEIKKVCNRHGIVLIGVCQSEGIAGEIAILDAANLRDDDISQLTNKAEQTSRIEAYVEGIGTRLNIENKAPWPDFKGNEIYEGDVIEHSFDGSQGTVIYLADETHDSDKWRVDYGDGDVLRLALQIGDKGQAVVVRKMKE